MVYESCKRGRQDHILFDCRKICYTWLQLGVQLEWRHKQRAQIHSTKKGVLASIEKTRDSLVSTSTYISRNEKLWKFSNWKFYIILFFYVHYIKVWTYVSSDLEFFVNFYTYLLCIKIYAMSRLLNWPFYEMSGRLIGYWHFIKSLTDVRHTMKWIG